jgi:hypothetical protein
VRINPKIKTPDTLPKVLAEIDMQLMERIKTLSRQLDKGRATKITKMTDGNYCLRIEKFHNAEKIKLDSNGKVSFTVNNQKFEGKLKSTASFPEEMFAVIHSVKEGV